MYVQEGMLFRAPLSTFLNDRLENVLGEVLQRDLDGLAREPLAALIKAAQYETPRLLRAEAEFGTDVASANVSVTVTVPVVGNERLLEYYPEGGERMAFRVRMTDHLPWLGEHRSGYSSGWGNERLDEDAPGGFSFRHGFPGTASEKDVREWAAGIIDRMEANLAAMVSQLDTHAQLVARRVTERAASRRQALTAAPSLKGKLGRGI